MHDMAIRATLIKVSRLSIQSFNTNRRKFITSTQAMSSSPSDMVNIQDGPGLLSILQKPKRLRRIRFLSELFKSHGFELRIAGGAVRDILSGKEPQDIDFATDALPEQTLDIVSKHGDLLRVIVTAAGQRHGTVKVKFKEVELDFKRVKSDKDQEFESAKPKEPVYDDESPYDITTLRCDKHTDGRHAEVEFINDWKKDAERRDLTINAMFLTLDEGKLIDYFNGQSDLNNGIVRFVGDADQRIKEDYLRILRFFRFWSRYGRNIQPDHDTKTKIRTNLDGLKQISGERIWHEIKKTFSHLPCHEVMKLMLELRLFDYAGLTDDNLNDYQQYMNTTLEEIEYVQENVQKYCDDVLNVACDTITVSDKRMKELLPVILFATAIRNETLCWNAYKRIKFSNLERDIILFLIENRNKKPQMDTFKYQLVSNSASERSQVLLCIKALLISQGRLEDITALEAWKIPQFPLSGTIVAKVVKTAKLPGNKTKEVLEIVKKNWAEGDYHANEEELVERMHEIVSQMKS